MPFTYVYLYVRLDTDQNIHMAYNLKKCNIFDNNRIKERSYTKGILKKGKNSRQKHESTRTKESKIINKIDINKSINRIYFLSISSVLYTK
jgi:hypothetical protein